MSNYRPVPVQELPENQAAEVAYVLDEQTGVKTPLAVEKGSVVEEKKRRGRPRRETATDELPVELGIAPEGDEE